MAGKGRCASMMLSMENNRFRVDVEMVGAELISILDKANRREYLWQGDPAVWAHRAPVLFPACGPLEGGALSTQGRSYPMEPGGFAMRLRHKLVCQDNGLICMRLESTPETEALYPYRFAVKTTYALKENRVSSRMKVLNYGKRTMYFRCGFLTAFQCPFVPGTTAEDYGVRLEQPEALTLLERREDGLLTRQTRMWEPERGVIPLRSGALDGGLLLKEPTSQYLQYSCGSTGEYVRVYLRGAPYAYLRTAPAQERQMLCVGSCHGTPDFAGSSAPWEQQENVIALGSMEEYYAHQTIEIGTV